MTEYKEFVKLDDEINNNFQVLWIKIKSKLTIVLFFSNNTTKQEYVHIIWVV